MVKFHFEIIEKRFGKRWYKPMAR